MLCNKLRYLIVLLMAITVMCGCGGQENEKKDDDTNNRDSVSSMDFNETDDEKLQEEKPSEGVNSSEEGVVLLSEKVITLADHLSAVSFTGDDYFNEFLAQGGAEDDAEIAAFLFEKLQTKDLMIETDSFGCSTLAVEGTGGERLFGRNFDWNHCNTLIVKSNPYDGYASIATVNTDFIQGVPFSVLPDREKALISLYVPMDGMNEKGLVVSVNMISDGRTINQKTNLPDITTTTAIRLILNQAATVSEAVELLQKYDFHASKDFMVHLAIADAAGDSVVVEYIDDEMSVVETDIVTNFYLTAGDRYGVGTKQSHERFEILREKVNASAMNMATVRDALSEVSKGNFNEFESTEWSIVFNQTTGEVHYYHRENYDRRYRFDLNAE